MSQRALKSYRFKTATQWARCLLHGLDLKRDGGALPTQRLGLRPFLVAPGPGSVSLISVESTGQPLWRVDAPSNDAAPTLFRLDDQGDPAGPFEVDPGLARAKRWAADRHWLWACDGQSSLLVRFERESLQRDRSLDVTPLLERYVADASAPQILDLTGDGHDGVWLLVRWNEADFGLLHVACDASRAGFWRLPCDVVQPTQLASVDRGRSLALLGAEGTRLTLIASADGSSSRHLPLPGSVPGFVAASALSGDGKQRLALFGTRVTTRGSAWAVLVLDGQGDVLEALPDVLSELPTALLEPPLSVAIARDSAWFGTPGGLYRIDTSERSRPRESESVLITPLLVSPESEQGRGFLRAELDVDLPDGAVLEANVATSDDPSIVEQAAWVARDPSASPAQRQERLWALLEPQPSRSLRVTGPSTRGAPLAIPLLESKCRYLALRLRIVTPPGSTPPTLRELRVLYPNLSIVANLPAIFNDERTDAAQLMRRLVGVLEATTQGLDSKIQRLGSYVDPEQAPAAWFDYLARWLDLPWDDSLPEPAKRELLKNAGSLLAWRGTRSGLSVLLQALLGNDGVARVRDLTVDHPLLRLGGDGCAGQALPALLAGTSGQLAILGGKARLGRARLKSDASEADPLRTLVQCAAIEIRATRELQRALEPLLPSLLAQYLPAGVRASLRWRVTEAAPSEDGAFVMEANGPGSLGRGSVLGRVTVSGRSAARFRLE